MARQAALLALAALASPSLAYLNKHHQIRTPRRHATRTGRMTPTAALPLILPLGPRSITRRRQTRRAASALPVDPFSIPELDTGLPSLAFNLRVALALLVARAVASQDWPALLKAYNRQLYTRPFTTKAVGTGATYFFSDLTAQALESEEECPTTRWGHLVRALKFASVGAFWVGPLLAAWFQALDHVFPGRSPRPVVTKIVLDQVLQGPFMIATMFVWTGLLQGERLAEALGKVRARLWDTWVKSVYVWSPVQAVQQLLVPLEYRVAVANGVSYFWDTYLAMEMAPSAPPSEELGDDPAPSR